MRRGSSAFRPGIVALALLGALAGMYEEAQARSEVEIPTAYGRVPDNIYALREPFIWTHNVGLLTLQITNLGLIGNPFIQDLSAGWRGGEYLFYSGLWIGAIGSDSEAHVSTAAPVEWRPDLDETWKIYESFEGLKGGIRVGPLGAEGADDDGDGQIDEDFHNGLDDDEDGRPPDEDYAAIGQQMFSCMYRDDTPEALAQISDHYPLNLLVQQRSFQWSTTGINEFVGLDFKIINHGDQRLKELYLGFFSDSDAGPRTADRYWTDDLVGWAHIDTTVVDQEIEGPCGVINLVIDTAFMWDAPDNGTSVVGGDVPGWFGALFLGHTTDDAGVTAPQNVGLTTVAWFSASGQNSDPQNDEERYALLSAATKPARNETKPDDYRYVIAAGPFASLNPMESLDFQVAYVIGDGETGFRQNAVNAQRVFNGIYTDADDNELTGVDGKERCLQLLGGALEIVWDDPCDTLTTTESIRQTPPCDLPSAVYVDADCDACTGVNGKETLVNWVGTTAPPPPATNTDPEQRNAIRPAFSVFTNPEGENSVTIQWDNASELRKDPITGDEIFEGYRIWRVDNWQRPEGSIGPNQDEWMKIAEFRLDADANEQGAEYLLSPYPNGPVVRTVGPAIDPNTGEEMYTEDVPPKPIYPIGRYRYDDTKGIINGKLYFYSVTAFGITTVRNPITGKQEEVELAGLPSATEAEAIVPRWNSERGCDAVRVVPNPYRGGADWDLVPSESDPTGTKLAFRNLPDEVSTIRIYTLSGDLVQQVVHDGTPSSPDAGDGNGTFYWNMISRNGQNIVSGVYLYSVTYSGGTCRGRFLIIR